MAPKNPIMTKSKKKTGRRAAPKTSGKKATKGSLAMGAKKAAPKSKSVSKKPSKLASLKSIIMGNKTSKVKAVKDKKSAKASESKGTKKVTAPSAAKTKKQAKALKSAKSEPASKTAASKVSKTTRDTTQKAAKPASNKKAAKEAAAARVSVARSNASEMECREVACEGLGTTGGYCRLHYIKNWKKIKRKELILKEGKLNQYIEELVAKYPDKYIEAIRHDLVSDKEFAKVIYDLDLDETIDDFEGDAENVDSLIDNIKRDFEDESEF